MKPTAIITADIHIPHKREYQPRCRTDNYWNTFVSKIEFISYIQKKYDGIPILDAGDLCNKSRLDPFVEAWSIKNLPENIITVPGNHEIPSHNLNYLDKSSLAVIEAGSSLSILSKDFYIGISTACIEIAEGIYAYGFPYGEEPHRMEKKEKGHRHVAICHISIYDTPPSFKTQYSNAKALLKSMKGFDLIICGHNHQSFTIEHNFRKLLNVGSLMRMSADQKDYQPRIFLWYAKNNELEPIDIPIQKGVVSDQYLRKQASEEDRMQAFIERLEVSKSNEINYEKNLKKFFEENPDIKKSVQDIVWKVME